MIDIRTFVLVLAIGNIGIAVLMAVYAFTSKRAAMHVWTSSKIMMGTAHLLNWFYSASLTPWLHIAANTALILGAATELGAYLTLFGIRRWKQVLYPALALVIACYCGAYFAGMSASELSAIFSCTIAALTGTMIWVLLRPAKDSSLLRRIIAITDLVFFIIISARGYISAVYGGLTLFTPHPVQSFTLITGYLLLIINGFGFLLLCKEKDDREMALLATTDSLTGLVNRRAFFERTEAARMLAGRMHNPISLMMLDIDHFKLLNDRFGHGCGDEALCLFARTALATLREHDIMGRLGGEEFAVVLPGTDLAGALQAAERLRAAVEHAVVPKHDFSMTVSIGVVLVDPNEDINAALARADNAMYQAKSDGRNRVESGELQLRLA